MKNTLTALFIGGIFLLLNACTKTGIDAAVKTVKNQSDERIMDTASYSRWLQALVPIVSPGKFYTVISGRPSTLTADVLKNGKVLVFGRKSKLDQPYSLPFKQYYISMLDHGITITRVRRTYFTAQVARIVVYDSLISKTYSHPIPPMAVIPQFYSSEFRCIIVPPSLKIAANAARLNWSDYHAVTSYFKIAP